MSARSDKITGEAMRVVGWGLLLTGAGILGTECFQWLHTGLWTPVAIGRGLASLGAGEPALNQWPGAQAVVRWLLAQPLSLALIIAGLLAIGLGLTSVDEAERRLHIERDV